MTFVNTALLKSRMNRQVMSVHKGKKKHSSVTSVTVAVSKDRCEYTHMFHKFMKRKSLSSVTFVTTAVLKRVHHD